MPDEPAARYETLQWVFFQMASVGPMFGQFGFFHKFGGREIEDRRPFERYRDETRRLLGVLEQRLDGRDWIMGAEFSIADIAMIGWVRTLKVFYGAGEVLGLEGFPRLMAWLDRAPWHVPRSRRGLDVPPRP